jgi:hypothetical protein
VTRHADTRAEGHPQDTGVAWGGTPCDYTPANSAKEVCPVSTFYHGDCLFVMRHDIPPESVDLIYLDPPFVTGKVQTGTRRPGDSVAVGVAPSAAI